MELFSNSNVVSKNETGHYCMFENICLNFIQFAELIVCLITFLFDFVIFFLIMRLKKKLIQIEFGLLLSFCINFIFIRLKLIIDLFFVSETILPIKRFLCIGYLMLDSFIAEYFFILFYYSLFHLTIWLQRNKIRKLVRNTNFLIFYLILSSILSFITGYSHISIKYGFFVQNYELCTINETKFPVKLLLVNLIYTIPAFAANFIYASMDLSLIKRLILKKISKIQLQRDRKNLIILSKFLCFSILSNLVSFWWVLLIAQNFFSSQILDTTISLINNLVIITGSFNSLILIFVHDKLKEELFNILKSLIKKLKYRKKFF